VLVRFPLNAVTEWVTVSAEHHVYVVDTGLSALDCDDLIEITEQACRGQYAAYTYAKQTLGCREFPTLARAARDVVHSVVYSIYERFAADNASRLSLDDREPHVVKYDVTKKERQKLDMHTDKSEFTFLIALSNGCGLDYDGGGTYFECLDATIHVQRGQAIVFPGKLRHCGQRITTGVRFLLVGFLVDKTAAAAAAAAGVGRAAGQASGMNPDDNLDPALLPHIGNIP
jgi:regulator of RNase E activity RraB